MNGKQTVIWKVFGQHGRGQLTLFEILCRYIHIMILVGDDVADAEFLTPSCIDFVVYFNLPALDDDFCVAAAIDGAFKLEEMVEANIFGRSHVVPILKRIELRS